MLSKSQWSLRQDCRYFAALAFPDVVHAGIRAERSVKPLTV